MQTTIADLKDLVLWMRKEKVAAFKAGGFEVTFTPDAFLADLPAVAPEYKSEEQLQAERKRREDEILFHSAG